MRVLADEVMYVGRVARRLGVSHARARELMDAGRLGPVHRDALGYRYVGRAYVEAFMRERQARQEGRAQPVAR